MRVIGVLRVQSACSSAIFRARGDVRRGTYGLANSRREAVSGSHYLSYSSQNGQLRTIMAFCRRIYGDIEKLSRVGDGRAGRIELASCSRVCQSSFMLMIFRRVARDLINSNDPKNTIVGD